MPLRTALLDMPAAEPHLGAAGRLLGRAVDLRVSADDGMETDDVHYLMAGSSALDAIEAALRLAGGPAPARILDFGSGAGRVTRWLRAAYPEAAVACCDLRPGDVAFCREVFGAEGWTSSADPTPSDLRGPHDLIWIGSVLTHVDEDAARRLVGLAMAALRPGGLLVASTLGRAGRAVQDSQSAYLQGDGWPDVKRAYDRTGYGYADYPAYEGFPKGYGLSLASPAWVARLAAASAGWRLVTLSEAAWDGTQDVFALQAAPSFAADPAVEAPRPGELEAARARLAAIEASTSWRLTAPLRRLATAIRRAG